MTPKIITILVKVYWMRITINQEIIHHWNEIKKTKKKTFIVGDSIAKHIDGWRLNKRIKSTVSVRSIPGATTKGMTHQVKGCLGDTSPDFITLHHGTNDSNGNGTSEEIADKILSLGASIKTTKN